MTERKMLNMFWFRGGNDTKCCLGEDRDIKEKKDEDKEERKGEWKGGVEKSISQLHLWLNWNVLLCDEKH
jgi:hypothetical protein